MGRALSLGVLLAWLPCYSLAQSHPHEATPSVLAPGYDTLQYAAPTPGSYELPPLGAAADGELLDVGGRRARLHTLMDARVCVLSFVYTRCDDVNGCPLATFVLRQLKRRLETEPQLADAVRLISVSFDPDHDTPDVMARYAGAFSSGRPDWQFLTARSAAVIAPLLTAYGQDVQEAYDADGRSTGRFAHILRVFLIDEQKRIRNIYSVAFLHADTLISDIKTLLLDGGTRVVAEQVHGAGDVKTGYESVDYVTDARHLPHRTGQHLDLGANFERRPLGLPAPLAPRPTDDQIQLGRKLFYDRRLSLNNTLSCAMCHIPEQGFTSNEIATAVGMEGRTVRRNAPTLYNVGFLTRLFHDGRESRLEQQVWQPLLSSNEMGNPAIGAVTDKLAGLADYAGLFERAFAGAPPGMETVGAALAAYERALISGNSPFDRWHYGKQEDALSPSAQRGFALFTGKARCASCHHVGADDALFTDQSYHNTGIGYRATMLSRAPQRRVQLAPGISIEVRQDAVASAAETPPSDLGRYEITQDPADRWKYRTAPLRNVALTSPYMHDGSVPTLDAVVRYYDQGAVPHEQLDPLIGPLDLSEGEIRDLVAFLKSLTGDNVDSVVVDAFAAPVGDPD